MKHMPTVQPVSWFIERDREESLVMRPSFQRRLVWKDPQKSNLIESILLDLPIPEIFIQVKTDAEGKSKYTVVDGQQRINTILEFTGVGERQEFELSGLMDSTSRWRGYSFSSLTDEQKAAFYGHSMAVRLLEHSTDEEVEGLFKRINKYITPLNPQELRNATYKGPFLRLSESLAEEAFWAEHGLATPQVIRRMRDIEFVSDLLIGVIHGPQSGSPTTLDDFYGVYEDYDYEIPRQREAKRRFLKSMETIQETIPNLRETRWSNRTDFYSLFVATADLLREHFVPGDGFMKLKEELDRFESQVTEYQSDEDAEVLEQVESYVEALRRGSSDKNRRGTRHRALVEVLGPYFMKAAR